jgi:hypothetical protein
LDPFLLSAEGVLANTGKITYGFMISSCNIISELTDNEVDPNCVPESELNPELWTLRTKAVFPFFSPAFYNENDKMEYNNVKADDLFFSDTVTKKDFDVFKTEITYKNNLAFHYYFFEGEDFTTYTTGRPQINKFARDLESPLESVNGLVEKMYFISQFNEDNLRFETTADRNTLFAAASGFGGFATMLFPVL